MLLQYHWFAKMQKTDPKYNETLGLLFHYISKEKEEDD